MNKTSKKEEKSRVKKVLRSQLLFFLFLFCLFFLFTKFAKVRGFFHLFCLIFSNSVKKNLANSANILRFVSLCHLRLKWSHLTLTFSFLSIWFLSFAESRPIVGPNFVQIQERWYNSVFFSTIKLYHSKSFSEKFIYIFPSTTCVTNYWLIRLSWAWTFSFFQPNYGQREIPDSLLDLLIEQFLCPDDTLLYIWTCWQWTYIELAIYQGFTG